MVHHSLGLTLDKRYCFVWRRHKNIIELIELNSLVNKFKLPVKSGHQVLLLICNCINNYIYIFNPKQVPREIKAFASLQNTLNVLLCDRKLEPVLEIKVWINQHRSEITRNGIIYQIQYCKCLMIFAFTTILLPMGCSERESFEQGTPSSPAYFTAHQ